MVEISIAYRGELRTEAVHGPSSSVLVTDAPTDNHGRGESFSPTDLVATALGACMLTIMGIQADRHAWDLSGTTVTVRKHMVSEPRRRIGKLEVDIRVPHDHEPKVRAALERAALGCPVHATLGDNVEMPVTFHWGTGA